MSRLYHESCIPVFVATLLQKHKDGVTYVSSWKTWVRRRMHISTMELYLAVFVNIGDCVGKLIQAHTRKYWTISFICGPKNAKPGVDKRIMVTRQGILEVCVRRVFD